MTYTFRPGRGVDLWLAVVGAGLPLVVLIALVASGPEKLTPTGALVGVGVPSLLAMVMAAMVRRNVIELDERRLRVRSSFYRFDVALSAIDAGSLRRVDLLVDREWRPRFRTNGVGVPGYRSGWFRLIDRSRAFLAMVGTKGIGFRTREGIAVLLSPAQIDDFETRLRAAIPAG